MPLLPRRAGTLRTWLRRLALASGVAALFAFGLIAGLLLHLDLGPSRRVIGRALDEALGERFEGEVRIDEIERVSARELRVGSVSVRATDGSQVLRIRELRARPSWLGSLGRSAAAGAPRLVVERLRVESAEVELVRDADGVLTIARAFAPRRRVPEVPEPLRPEAAPEAAAGLSLPNVEIGTIAIRGKLGERASIEAELRRLAASIELTGSAISLEIDRAGLVERRLLPQPIAGSVSCSLGTKPRRLVADFSGHLGELEVAARAELRDEAVVVTASLPRIAPDHVRALWPSWPLGAELAAALRLEGTPPLLGIDGRLDLASGGTGELQVAGALRLGDPSLLDLRLVAHRLDAHQLAPVDQATDLSGEVRVHASLAGEQTELVASFETEAGRFGDTSVPPAQGTLLADRDGVGSWLRAAEPGSRIDAAVELRRASGAAFAVETAPARLDEVPRLQEALARAGAARLGRLRGSATLRGRGELRQGRLDARLGAELEDVAVPAGRIELRQVNVQGRLQGPPGELQIEGRVAGAGLRLAGRPVGDFELDARGPVREPAVRAKVLGPQDQAIAAEGLLSVGRRELHNLRLAVQRGGAELGGRIARVSLGGGAVALDGIDLAGLGGANIAGRIEVGRGELRGELRAATVPLGPLSRLLGLRFPARGTASLDLRVGGTGDERRGELRLGLRGAGMLVVSGVNLDLAVAIEGPRIRPRAVLVLAESLEPAPFEPGQRCTDPMAVLRLDDAELALPGALLDRTAWQAVTGQAALQAMGLQLGCLGEVTASWLTLPWQELSGALDAWARLVRPPGQRLPSLAELGAVTHGLRLVARPAGDDAAPALTSDRLDLELGGSLDGRTGEARARLGLRDGALLAELAAALRLDLESLLAAPGTLAQALRAAPLSASLHVPRRALGTLSSLPSPLRERLPPLGGDFQLDGYLEGSAGHPVAAVRLRTWGAAPAGTDAAGPTPAGAPPWALPLDADILASYDGARTTLASGAVSHGGRRFLSADATLEADLGAWIDPASRPLQTWSGSVAARLDRFALESVPRLAAEQIRGEVSGRIAVEQLGRQPRLRVKLDAPEVQWGPAVGYENATLTIEPSNDPFEPRTIVLHAEVPVRGGGRLAASAYGALAWAGGLVPSLDRGAAAELYVQAQHFPLGTLQPLLRAEVNKLDGRLDGGVRLGWQRVSEEDHVTLGADVWLTGGAIHVPRLGQELSEVVAHLSSGQKGLLRIDPLTASAQQGRISGKLVARMQGLRLSDLTGAFTIPDDHELPLTFEGVALGSARGTVAVSLERKPDAVDLVVSSQDLHLDLPSSSHDVQPLGANPDIATSHLLGPPEGGRLGPGVPWRVTLGLGRVVVEGSALRLSLSSGESPPRFVVGDHVEVGGEIRLDAGELQVLGKTFVLDRGVLRLRREQPDNPYVNVTAHWDAPDGTVVTVSYVGLLQPVVPEKFKFSSAPPRSEEEILALLVEGDTARADAAGGAGQRAARALVALRLDALLGRLRAPGGLSTHLGTTEEGMLATSVSYDVSDGLTARATFERTTGAEPPAAERAAAGATPGAAEGSTRTSIQVDWRFLPDWLLRGTLGLGEDARSGLDVLWQHAY
ncbi:MAG: translocation/assembly module TamB domain-containing protein [Deltaproteobacteria bacterium]|nr:translocation/assembly module TamB domain-containing protein [Deltaproteobacteria bacterium]